jgi:tetratricopeptide (TPR) repeat protein
MNWQTVPLALGRILNGFYCIQVYGRDRINKEMTRWLPILLATAGLLGAAGSAELERARQLFKRSQYQAAVTTLAPVSTAADGPTQELLGKSYFMLAEYKKAAEAFERATAINPNSSIYFHWLGKAQGRRAETASPFTAPAYASKARQAFEKAVELDGKNIEAINDLFSYYLEAPGFLGGGLDKAAELAKRIQVIDPVEFHYAMAQVSDKRKDYRTAESHFRRAFELAPRQVGRIIDLAKYLSVHGKEHESDGLFLQAEKIAPDEPRVMFERAQYLIRAKKDLGVAKALLERYLKAPLTVDDPPRAEAQKLLKQTSGA